MTNRTMPGALAALLAVTLLAGCAHAQTAAPLTLLDYTTTTPSGWATRPPASTARLAELVLRDAAAKDSVELVVYHFGAGQGGGIEANVARWTAQFTDAAGVAAKPRTTRLKGTKFPTTLVELEGNYTRAIGMGDPANAKPGQALYAAIVETPRGNLYVQMFGTAARVRAQRDAYLKFVRGIRER